MSESEKLDRRSLTPCLDENRVDDDNNCADNSKEIEYLSDISDEDENDNQWKECNKTEDLRANGNDRSKESTFKKITKSTRERNYRDNVKRRLDGNDLIYSNRVNYRNKFDNSRRKEIERYNVRKVIANRDFSMSRSRSRSFTPRGRAENIPQRHAAGFSPRRDIYNKRSASPVPYETVRHTRRYSPKSPRHSVSPLSDRYRNYHRNRSLTPEEAKSRRSRSRHKHSKLKSSDKTLRKRKHKSRDHQRKHNKKSRSKSKRHSTSHSASPEPGATRVQASSPTRQIMNVANPNLPQENIKVILKNEDVYKRQKVKKREKKKKEKMLKEKNSKELPQTKEVFASGDNILISVCFNNNNNNNSVTDNGKSKSEHLNEELQIVSKPKPRKRQQSPLSASSVSSLESEKRQRKHKRKKIRNRKEKLSKIPKTVPPATNSPTITKRKSDVKPIAIIDLEKSPGKEVTQSPKEVIVLSDSEGEGKKREMGGKDIIIVEDTLLEKGTIPRNHSPIHREHLTPINTPPESPPPMPAQQQQMPSLKFSLKSKSNVLPFNLLHDQADEIEEPPNTTTNTVTNVHNSNDATIMKNNLQKEQDLAHIAIEEKTSNQNEAYDPFEPTKSGSTSPVTPPHPHPNDVSSSSDTLKNKIDSLNEKIQLQANKETNQIPGIGDDHLIPSSSIWNRKEFDKKISQPTTPPLPPAFNTSNIFSSSSSQISKPHVSLYDGIYGSDLKSPAVPSNIKPSLNDKNKNNNNNNDDDRTPYSPSSDGYDYEPPANTSIHQKSSFETLKHSDIDTQSSEPSGSFSFGNPAEESTSKSGPLKLTASTLKTFNSTMRSQGPIGLQFVNKAELSIFENYLPASQQKSPLVKRQSNSSFLRSKMSRFASSMNENGSPHRNVMGFNEQLKPPVIDESILDDDEVPSSAVDLVNKDRFLKKSLRIERVAEEVKLVLKPHYNKKHISKEEYKEILRKAVPKICHNKTGEINIQKITQLIEAYIKKVRYKRKAGIASSI